MRNSNILNVFLAFRFIIFLWIARRTAPDFDYNSDSAVTKSQVGPVTKDAKNDENFNFQFEPITLNRVTQGSSW